MSPHWCHRRPVSLVGTSNLALLFVGYFIAPERPVAQQLVPPAALAFRDVTVIDVSDGRLLPNQTVVILGNRIQAVGPVGKVAVPKGATVVRARGKYLLPGLWDMHVHLEPQDSFRRWAYPRFVANGVTGIREIAQPARWADSLRAWQRENMAGPLVVPRSIGSSTDVDGMLTSLDRVPHVVDSLKAVGDAFIKYHGNNTNRDIFFALLRESRRVGLPVIGHVPPTATTVEASDSGMRSIEHTGGTYNQCWGWGLFKVPPPDSAALEAACAPVAQAYIRNGTWATPTMRIEWQYDSTSKASLDGVGCTSCIGWAWADGLRFWRTMHRLGVRRFLVGTDWNASGFLSWPGLSARDEMIFLVDAGLTPLEAVQAGTLNPAMFLGATDSLGTVAPGKLADLVLLDANPLADITNVLQLRGVVANGHYFDHAALMQIDSVGLTPGNSLAAWDHRLKRAPNTGQRDRQVP